MINDPSSLEIELTSKCTLFCPECPRTKDANEQEHAWNFGEISLDAIDRLLQSIVNTKRIIFSGAYGDPIYHTKFIEIMELCKKYDKSVTVNTNGSYRSAEWWSRLARTMGSNVCFVFSVDGLENTNKIYRINADWPSIMTGMKIMASEASTPIEWKWILFKQNEHQIEDAYRLSKELGVGIFTVVKSGRPYPPGMEPSTSIEEILEKLEKVKASYDTRS